VLLTAQRVVSPRGTRGVNVYQYLHGSYVWPRVPDGFLPDVNPGELVNQWLEVPPGSNRIVSFLDVVAPDEVATSDVHQRLASLKYHVQANGHRTEVYWDPYWMRFGSAVVAGSLQTELGALAGHILLSLTGNRGGLAPRGRPAESES
jgi:hypothetical protein